MIKFETSKIWEWWPKIIRNCGDENTYKSIFAWLFFHIAYLNIRQPLVPGEAYREKVTSAGLILTTESDEKDKVYIINRNRGFEMSYYNYEIVMKNGTLHVYKYDSDTIPEETFENTIVNLNTFKNDETDTYNCH